MEIFKLGSRRTHAVCGGLVAALVVLAGLAPVANAPVAHASAAGVYCNVSHYPTLSLPYWWKSGQVARYECYMSSGFGTAVAKKALQRSYNKCYGRYLPPYSSYPDHIDVDGIYGSQTTLAVKYIQSVNDLAADGLYGPETVRKMKYFQHQSGTCQRVYE